jgi:hypothetical protein
MQSRRLLEHGSALQRRRPSHGRAQVTRKRRSPPGRASEMRGGHSPRGSASVDPTTEERNEAAVVRATRHRSALDTSIRRQLEKQVAHRRISRGNEEEVGPLGRRNVDYPCEVVGGAERQSTSRGAVARDFDARRARRQKGGLDHRGHGSIAAVAAHETAERGCRGVCDLARSVARAACHGEGQEPKRGRHEYECSPAEPSGPHHALARAPVAACARPRLPLAEQLLAERAAGRGGGLLEARPSPHTIFGDTSRPSAF